MWLSIQEPALIVFVLMCSLFVVAQIKKNNSIVDFFWGIGFILIALYTLYATHLFLPRQFLVSAMVLVWGTRLSYYIFLRNYGKPEDSRYAAWRAEWGKWIYVRSFLQIFMLQGFLMLIIATPLIAINTSLESSLNMLDALGFLIWLTGLIIEIIADKQLAQFLSSPREKNSILTTGLWHYSRHPNYFGEALLWWGIWLIALSVPYGWITIISPLCINGILRFISLPITENQWNNNPAYTAYAEKTNPILLFPYKF